MHPKGSSKIFQRPGIKQDWPNMKDDSSQAHQLTLLLVVPSVKTSCSFGFVPFACWLLTDYFTSRFLYCTVHSFGIRNLWITDRLHRRFLQKYVLLSPMPTRSVRLHNAISTALGYLLLCGWRRKYHMYHRRFLSPATALCCTLACCRSPCYIPFVEAWSLPPRPYARLHNVFVCAFRCSSLWFSQRCVEVRYIFSL